MIQTLSGHLTARNKATIEEMLKNNMLKGGTKLIQYEIIPGDPYWVSIWEKYATASREFNLTPGANIVRWHYQGKVKFTIK